MKKIEESKLVLILKRLSTLEIKRFKKFLDSPYHNSSKERIELFRLLKKYHPNYNAIPFSKEELYKKIFGKEKYQIQKMNDLMISLKGLVEDFMITSDILNEKKKRKAALIDSFKQRNISLFRELSKEIVNGIKETEIPMEEDYLKLYLEYKRLYFHINNEQKINGASIFQEAHKSLDLFYLFAKFQFLTEEQDRKNIFNESSGLISLDQIEQITKGSKLLEENTAIELLYRITNLRNNNYSKEFFLNLKEDLTNLIGQIESSMLRDLFMKLVNYCIHKNNLGDSSYNLECLDIYKILVEHKLLLENNIIREIEYINIALLAYKYGPVEWADNFSITYKKNLSSPNPEGICDIVFAYKFFFIKKYKMVDKYLNRLSPEVKGFYYPRVKALVIRSLYEDWMIKEEYSPALLNHANSYERFLYRHQEVIAEEKVKAYLNFIQILKKLAKFVSSEETREGPKIDTIKQEIVKRKTVAFEHWLSEKIQELEKRK